MEGSKETATRTHGLWLVEIFLDRCLRGKVSDLKLGTETLLPEDKGPKTGGFHGDSRVSRATGTDT